MYRTHPTLKTQLTPKTRYTTHTSHSAFISHSWLYSGYTTHLTLSIYLILRTLLRLHNSPHTQNSTQAIQLTSHSAFISHSWLYSGYTTHLTLGTHPIFGELAADFQTLGVVDSRTELTADDRSFLVTEPTEIVVTIVLQNTETKIWRGWQTINESLINCPANLVLQSLDFICSIYSLLRWWECILSYLSGVIIPTNFAHI